MQLLKRSKEKFVHDRRPWGHVQPVRRTGKVSENGYGGSAQKTNLSSCWGQERDRGSRDRDGRWWRKEESNAPGHQEQPTKKGSNGRCLPWQPGSQVKPPGKLLKAENTRLSLARKCVSDVNEKALAKLNSLKAAVSQRNKFFSWNKEINPSSAMETRPETKAFKQICMCKRLTEQLGILRV